MNDTAPIISINRHRLTTDGVGVTTLVGFYGCPLRCHWCLNPFSFAPDTRRVDMTAKELYDRTKIDALYFEATGGGVTFGGGEPLLYASFLAAFRALCSDSWHLCAETSLAVPLGNVQTAAEVIDVFLVDCKDTNPAVYRRYTGRDNAQMLSNLAWLLQAVGAERVIVRLPLIPEFNTDDDRDRSREQLYAMGVRRFDEFSYIRPKGK